MKLSEKLKLLNKFFTDKGKAAIAFSGGVDSSFLLKAAYDSLKGKAVAITVSSPAHSNNEINAAKRIAKSIGAKHIVLTSDKLERGAAKNPINRCYICKKSEFNLIIDRAKKSGIACVVEGTNSDDQSDYRPGIKATQKLGVLSPLKMYGFTKAEIRKQSKKLGLPTWDKPSKPCLMSRFPYGIEITVKKLRVIESAEEAISSLGIKNLRVRYHNEIARIEVNARDFTDILSSKEMILRNFKKLGFKYVCLDLEGFRTGSLNEGLKWTKTE